MKIFCQCQGGSEIGKSNSDFQQSRIWQIRTVLINGEIWFVGKDVATALSYADTDQAIRVNVDDEDKKSITRKQWEEMALNKEPVQTAASLFGAEFGGTQRLTFINESGLYSLIFSSKLPKAKEFKHWVTSEVLPSIRKYGYYFAPNAEMHLREFAMNSVTTEEEKAKVENYIPVLSLQVKAMIKKFIVDYEKVTEEKLPLVLDFPGEIWKWIKDCEGYYQASTFGRVRSFLRGKFRIIKPSVTHREYLSVCLYKMKDGKMCKKTFRLNRIIAETFIPNPENKPEVHHRDNNPANNAVWNLEWVTGEENKEYARQDGRYLKGEKNPSAKLTEEDVRFIREHYKAGDPEFGNEAFADRFKVSDVTITNIVTFKSWKHVK